MSQETAVAYAHMANTIDAVQWAVDQGMNGVEMDLRFKSDGTPSVFQHGGIACDCTCTSGDDTICSVLGDDPCNAQEDAVAMVKALNAHSSQLAVIYVDSKVDSGDLDLSAAGAAVIQLFDKNLLAHGFAGQVLINTPALEQIAYARAAAKAANASPHRDRYYFTFDGEGNEFEAVAEALVKLSPNRGYSTGITACLPGDYENSVQRAALNQEHGSLSFAAIWTLDKQSSMDDYLDAGANGLMTNTPRRALAALKSRSLELAKPGEAFRPSTSDRINP